MPSSKRKTAPSTITLRPMTAADRPFLRDLYATTRQTELEMTRWTAAQKEQFITMQFTAQLNHYQEQFPHATHDIILKGKKPIGRIYIDRRDDEIRLLDITLHPKQRNRGLGGRLIRDLLTEGQQTSRPVRLYVWENNHAAKRLYERLGFTEVEHQAPYIYMEWLPADPHTHLEDKHE